jgi:Doublecortin
MSTLARTLPAPIKTASVAETVSILSPSERAFELHRARPIFILRNGDRHPIPRRVVISFRKFKNFEQFLVTATSLLSLSTPARRVYASSSGTRVENIAQFEANATYIIAGLESFEQPKEHALEVRTKALKPKAAYRSGLIALSLLSSSPTTLQSPYPTHQTTRRSIFSTPVRNLFNIRIQFLLYSASTIHCFFICFV